MSRFFPAVFFIFSASTVHADVNLYPGKPVAIVANADLQSPGQVMEATVERLAGEFKGGVSAYEVKLRETCELLLMRVETQPTDSGVHGVIRGGIHGLTDRGGKLIEKFSVRFEGTPCVQTRDRKGGVRTICISQVIPFLHDGKVQMGFLSQLYFRDQFHKGVLAPLYWYPHMAPLAMEVLGSRIVSHAGALLADLSAVDGQDCVYVGPGGKPVHLDPDSGRWELCVGAKTTEGTVRKFYRSLVMGSTNSDRILADVDGKIFDISRRPPFDVYP